WHASSITGTDSPTLSLIPFMSTGVPYRWTGMIAEQCFPISLTSSGLINALCGTTSTKRGVAPACMIALAVAMKLIGVVRIARFVLIPNALIVRNKAVVPLEIETA